MPSCEHRVKQLEKAQDLVHEAVQLHNAAGCLIIRGNHESAWQFVTGVTWASVLPAERLSSARGFALGFLWFWGSQLPSSAVGSPRCECRVGCAGTGPVYRGAESRVGCSGAGQGTRSGALTGEAVGSGR